MSYEAEAYWAVVDRRSPKRADKGWSCLCCRDTGIVDPFALDQFCQIHLEPSDPAYRCRRDGCNEGRKFPPGSLLDIDANLCGFLHDRMWDWMKEPAPASPEVIAKVKSLHLAIVPDVPRRDLANDPILRRDPASEFYDGEDF
jgi:hypothetical protein